MTEAGKKWMESIAELLDDSSDILFPDHEIVLRAFCDEVDRRTKDKTGKIWIKSPLLAYEQTRDELLGRRVEDGL